MIRSYAGLVLCAALLAGCSSEAPLAPSAPPQGGDALRLAVPVRVDVRAGTVSLEASSTAAHASGGPSLALVGLNEITVATSNVQRSAVVAKKVRIRFDVAITSKLQGASLVTPTYPLPPLGEKRLLLFPFSISQISGGGKVAASTDWDGAPYNFFNDATCTLSSGSDCYRWKGYASPLGPGATTAAQTVGFDVDQTVQSFTVYFVLAADVQNLGTVTGHITSPEAGPLGGVTVTVQPGGGVGSTAATGRYEILNAPLGMVGLFVSNVPQGCIPPSPVMISVAAGATTTADFTVTCLGQKIVFSSNRQDGAYELYTMNPDGSAPTRLTHLPGGNFTPRWSPDRSKLAFVSNGDGDSEIYLLDLRTNALTRLTDNSANDFDAAWSPDGSRIAFTSDRSGNQDLFVMDADGSNVAQITSDPANDSHPTWSPDGSRLAFNSTRDNTGRTAIYVMTSAGGGATRLTDPSVTILDFDPNWSGDGSRILFTSFRDGAPQVYVMNADGSGQTRVSQDVGAHDSQPIWSPDDSRIVFKSVRNGNPTDIYTMHTDGTEPVRLTANGADDTEPDW